MKLHFEPDPDFQREAIEAVCDLFRGQEVCRNDWPTAPHGAVLSLSLQGFQAFLVLWGRAGVPSLLR